MCQGGRELASLVQPRTEQTGDLLDQRLTGKEGIILLGCSVQDSMKNMSNKHFNKRLSTKILDKFFVLVQFFQSFSIHERKIVGLGFITMLLIA